MDNFISKLAAVVRAQASQIAALENLCQQQHEALDSLCDNIELGCGCDGNGDVFDLAVAENALAAYAALFPKTGGAKGETKP